MKIENIKKRYLQLSIGIVYLWFGALKFFPNLSPAENLAIDTIDELTLSLIPSRISLITLAIWETLVGLCLILNWYSKATVRITVLHMVLTFTPLYFFPDLIFKDSFLSLTLLGQYIIKNLIILGALGVLWIEIKQDAPVTKKKYNPIATPLVRWIGSLSINKSRAI